MSLPPSGGKARSDSVETHDTVGDGGHAPPRPLPTSKKPLDHRHRRHLYQLLGPAQDLVHGHTGGRW